MNRARKIVLVIYLLVMTVIGIYVPWQWGRSEMPSFRGYHLFFTPTVWQLHRLKPNFSVIFLEVLTATSLCGIGMVLTTREK